MAVLAFTAGVSVASDGSDANYCLSAEDRGELTRRVMEAGALIATESYLPLQLKRREAAEREARARATLVQCEAVDPSQCQAERTIVQASSDVLAGLNAEIAKARSEIPTRMASRIRAIRAEYPACGTIGR